MIARRSTSRKRSESSGSSKPQPSSIVFFADRCLGAYDLPSILRDAGLRVEVHKDHFNSDVDDPTWITEVGKRGWVILTKDCHIRTRQLEIIALLQSGQPAFVLSARNTTAAENARAILTALRDMLACIATHPRPFVAQITAAGRLSILETQGMLIRKVR